MRVHTGRLILVPTAAEPLPDTTGLVTTLTEGGFIGAPLPGPGQGYLVGERFLSLITFAGCSVRIELLPPEDGSPFCHIIVDGPQKTPRLLSGRNTRPPTLPGLQGTIEGLAQAYGAVEPLRLPATDLHPMWRRGWNRPLGLA